MTRLDELPELPWPDLGDDLFVDDPDSDAAVSVTGWDYSWMGLAGTYAEAAKVLVRAALEDETLGRDRLAVPILFLYRQHIELALKAIIVRGGALLPRRPDINHHNLFVLWDHALNIAEQIWPGSRKKNDTKAVRRALKVLMELDPTSTASRYPEAASKKAKVLPKNFQFDIRHFAAQVEKITNYLGGTFDGVDNAMQSGP